MSGQGALQWRTQYRPVAGAAGLSKRPMFGLGLKLGFTVAALWLVWLVWSRMEPGSFPWCWDVAMLATAAALWLESRLLASMAAVAVLLPELAWLVGFVSRLLGGSDPFGLAIATFEALPAATATFVALMYFVLPALLLRMLLRLGYESRALRAQTLLAWSLMWLGYLLAETVGARFGGSLAVGASLSRAWLPAWVWLAAAMFAYPALVYIPAHLVLRTAFRRPRAGRHHAAGSEADDAFGCPPRGAQARRRARVLFALAPLRRRR